MSYPLKNIEIFVAPNLVYRVTENKTIFHFSCDLILSSSSLIDVDFKLEKITLQ